VCYPGILLPPQRNWQPRGFAAALPHRLFAEICYRPADGAPYLSADDFGAVASAAPPHWRGEPMNTDVNTRNRARLIPVALLLALALPVAAATSADALLKEKCGGCHEAKPGGGLARIDEARRTPEGWDMTVARMTLIHGVKLSGDERRQLVAHLADSAGLAPSEAQPWRYVLEHRPSAQDQHENERVGEICARCHTYARIALQRRSEPEWLKLVHFHVGQFPTLELQSGGRDRDWWEIASKEVPGLLGRLYPLQTDAWKAWQAKAKHDPSGAWRVAGHRPGWGDYVGEMKVDKADGHYTLSVDLRYADGRRQQGSGKANLFTGYEWRASVTQGDEKVRQVFALAEDGRHLTGRWFIEDVDVLGGDFQALKVGAASGEILAVQPARLKAGARQTIAIHGSGLAGEVSLGDGVRVLRVVSRSPETVVVEAQAAAKAVTGMRPVKVGNAGLDSALAVYRRIDALRIEPPQGLARVGGKGGAQPKLPVQYEAVAYAAGADGKLGTADDLRLGVVPARWQMANLNKAAVAMRDADFAGSFAGGLFVPGDAGPNRKRKFGTNNAGEIKVTATASDGSRQLKATAPLIVTVQRWNDPPIR
jgi:quinohemoprotein amine dehydrogenase